MKNKKVVTLLSLVTAAVVSMFASGCGSDKNPTLDLRDWDYTESIIDDKYRNFYEVYVASYYDSDGNGCGDLRGLGLKMKYIHDLGFNGVWMMPIHPSNSYHKYNVDDYYKVDSSYGNMSDKNLMGELASSKHH